MGNGELGGVTHVQRAYGILITPCIYTVTHRKVSVRNGDQKQNTNKTEYILCAWVKTEKIWLRK
jgi:hypothetical protein